MDAPRLHRATSNDGTEIVGHVEGHGPPLVLVHGSLEDGDLSWEAMLPHLRHRFTCYLPSTRSRGLSGDSADLAPQRRLEDIVAFVDSIGEPVQVFGESDGATLALGTAAGSRAVTAVAAYEPVVFEVADEDIDALLQSILPPMAQAVAEGRLTDAARRFLALIANDDELASLEGSDYLPEAAQYIPVFLKELEQGTPPAASSPTDPSTLANIDVPLLLMHGSRSALHDWFAAGVDHVAEHVSGAQVREIDGAGHFGVSLRPEAIAGQLATFFSHTATAV